MKKLLKIPKNLYHLSIQCHDGETFKPRIPSCTMDEEDRKRKRICFSSTISGAYRALPKDDASSLIYVHIPQNIKSLNGRVYIPSEKEVPDVWATREKWVTRNVKLKCIGIVRIRPNFKRFGFYPKDDCYCHYLNMSWVKKF